MLCNSMYILISINQVYCKVLGGMYQHSMCSKSSIINLIRVSNVLRGVIWNVQMIRSVIGSNNIGHSQQNHEHRRSTGTFSVPGMGCL